MRRYLFARRGGKQVGRPFQPRRASRSPVTRDAGIRALQCGYGCNRDCDGESNTKQDYRCAMLTIYGRASTGNSDNAKLMYWFPLIGGADARQLGGAHGALVKVQ